MKAVLVMFDSLNRRFLPAYQNDPNAFAAHAPNFARLAARCATFDRAYVCSMPCMPARRDLHTGRPNFLHRSWGPIEPFDDSMPQILKEHGVHTHLVTDHQHYWEDGGATYHQRYATFELVRGQEGDKWQPLPDGVPPAANAFGRNASLPTGRHPDSIDWQDRINRHFMRDTADLPQTRTFDEGLRFLDLNHATDRWLLHLETFDPHEPFHTTRFFKDLYAEHYDLWEKTDGRLWDWPGYEQVLDTHSREMVDHMRHQYAALVSMCDANLGRVLDAFDRYKLWDDTMLIVCTDHGFLLGEHDWWAKMRMPWWNELANTPFFVWDPRAAQRGVAQGGTRRGALVQPAIDLAPTLLRYFGALPTADMTGHDLAPVIASDTPVREAAIYGVHGGHVNVTDGRHVYMRGPAGPTNAPLFEYTLMPTHMKNPFHPKELQPDRVALAEPFPFMKGCATMRIGDRPAEQRNDKGWSTGVNGFGTRLYDLDADPGQESPVTDATVEAKMTQHLVREMQRAHAPAEQYQRLGLSV